MALRFAPVSQRPLSRVLYRVAKVQERREEKDMKTSALAQTSPKGRALIAVVIAAVLVVIGVGVTRAAAEGEPQKIAAAAASTKIGRAHV